MVASYPNTNMGFSNGAESQITGGSVGANERCRIIAQTFKFQWIRLNAWADGISPSSNWFDNAKANGLRVIAVLDGGQCTTAGVDALYTNHAGKFDAIEVGNECSAGNRDPDYSGLVGSGSGPDSYAVLLRSIYNRVRTFHSDTNTPVLVCGLTNDGTPNWGHNPQGWLQAMCQAIQNQGLLGDNGHWPFDGACSHWYLGDTNAIVDPGTQTTYTYGGMAVVDGLYTVLNGFSGAPKTVWATEGGYDSVACHNNGTETNIPGYVTSMINQWRARSFTSVFCWFCFEMDANSENPDAYGTIAPNTGTVAAINAAAHRIWYPTLLGFGGTTDATAPTVSYYALADATGPVSNVDNVTVRGTLQVTANATDPDDAQNTLTVALSIYPGAPDKTKPMPFGGVFLWNQYLDTTTLPNGTNVLVLQAWDPAGNPSPTVVRYINVQNVGSGSTPPKSVPPLDLVSPALIPSQTAGLTGSPLIQLRNRRWARYHEDDGTTSSLLEGSHWESTLEQLIGKVVSTAAWSEFPRDVTVDQGVLNMLAARNFGKG